MTFHLRHVHDPLSYSSPFSASKAGRGAKHLNARHVSVSGDTCGVFREAAERNSRRRIRRQLELAPMPPTLTFRVDDLSGAATRALIARHLAGMHEHSPPESVHAFDVDKLRQTGVTFWSVWVGEELAGCGALKQLDAERGEIKSMRVADSFLGCGIGRAILEHLMREARTRGLRSLWLETGSPAAFTPALRLYESAGFERCGPFEGYTDDPFSVFMTRAL